MPSRRFAIAAFAAAAVVSIAAPLAADEKWWFSNVGGIAIGGYDPVAYFVRGEATPGDPGIAVMWKGAIWYFATVQGRAQFEANPHAYAPQYGGFCAWHMSRGEAMAPDPRAFTIANGALFLYSSGDKREAWRRNVPAHVAEANQNWPAVLN